MDGSTHKPGSTGILTEGEFARLFEQHSRALWCVAAGVLSDRELARDAVQESAITGLRKLAEFQPGSSYVHWMGQIVRFTALNLGRKRRLRVAADVETANLSIVDPGGTGIGRVEEDFDDQTLAALGRLEETARTCLLMRTVLDMSYRQISEALGIAEGTAMSHVHRSRVRMRDAIVQSRRLAEKGGR